MTKQQEKEAMYLISLGFESTARVLKVNETRFIIVEESPYGEFISGEKNTLAAAVEYCNSLN